VIRVLIVEDEPLFRTGVRLIMQAEPDIEVVGEVSDGAQALEAAGRLDVDVVLMDVRMSGVDGLEATRRLAARGGESARVVILTSFDLDEYIDRALAIGVSAFVLKSASAEELVAAVRTVGAGNAFLSPSITRRVIDAFARHRVRLAREPEELATLSRREREVLLHLARGMSNREIAGALGIGETTVRTHVGHLLMKLNLRDRTQAALLAQESGILDDAERGGPHECPPRQGRPRAVSHRDGDRLHSA
jgi:DNA-binding NarL/FixJ family response regulator